MRTFEEVVKAIRSINFNSNKSSGSVYIDNLLDELLMIHKAEKKQIIKALEDEKDATYEDFEFYADMAGIDSEYDDYFHCGLDRAIEIVKRGGKKCS